MKTKILFDVGVTGMVTNPHWDSKYTFRLMKKGHNRSWEVRFVHLRTGKVHVGWFQEDYLNSHYYVPTKLEKALW